MPACTDDVPECRTVLRTRVRDEREMNPSRQNQPAAHDQPRCDAGVSRRIVLSSHHLRSVVTSTCGGRAPGGGRQAARSRASRSPRRESRESPWLSRQLPSTAERRRFLAGCSGAVPGIAMLGWHRHRRVGGTQRISKATWIPVTSPARSRTMSVGSARPRWRLTHAMGGREAHQPSRDMLRAG
jgi:hypothetical protein